MSSETKQPPPQHGSVWYATRADPLMALKPMLWFRPPGSDQAQLLEPTGKSRSKPESIVDAVLATAGFSGMGGASAGLSLLDDERLCVRHYGFDVPADSWDEVASQMRAFLSGELGGWTTVLMGQTGFHAPAHIAHVLGAVWAQAGRPPIQVAHNLGAFPRKAGDHRVPPANLLGLCRSDRRSDLAFERFKGLDPSQRDLLTDQRTYRQVQIHVEIAPETCALCGGRLYRHEGHLFCASAAAHQSQPDIEME